jgi:5-methyltetrahydropteroyltriglutamate--homocysteine methyltransferase
VKHSTDRILTTHVGSLPRAADLAGMVLSGQYTKPETRAAFDDRAAAAVKEVVQKQVEAGIDVVSDGEQSKPGFVNYIKDRLDGFNGEAAEFKAGDLLDMGISLGGPARPSADEPERPNWTPACNGEVRYREHDAYRKDIEHFQAALEGEPVVEAFMCAISPGNVAQVLPNQYYPSRRDYLIALADAMKEEYQAIADSGVLLQLDACDLAMDRHVNFNQNTVEEFREVIDGNVEVFNYAAEGIPRDRIRLHLCWGNYPGPHHLDVPLNDIIDIVLKVRCGAVSFEAANPRHGHEWHVWQDVTIPEDLILIPGVIDTMSTYIEHPELVAERIENFAGVVGRERVIAGTDCGFGTFVFTQVPEHLAYRKLRALSDGAAIASKRLF